MKAHDCREELHAIGSRATPGRLAVLKLLEQSRAPLTAIEIQKKLHRLNLVTVYRILDSLAASSLIRKGVADRIAHFEYAEKPHHHHLVCVDCGFNSTCKVC